MSKESKHLEQERKEPWRNEKENVTYRYFDMFVQYDVVGCCIG